MTDQEYFEAFDAQAKRRAGRRAFFKATLVGAAAAGVATTSSFLTATAAEAQAVTDADVLNFALNLEYLEANFYYYAAYGIPIPNTSIGGTGVPATTFSYTNAAGATAMANAGARAVKFSDPNIQQYATEIAQDEFAHVQFLRSALGSAAVSQPQLDVGTDPNGSFSTAARAAGLIGATTAAAPTAFDPYASDTTFLYGAFIFEDVGVTAYKGASPLISNPVYLDAAAGILAAEAYHASIVRLSLDQLGLATPSIVSDIGKISALRDAADGSVTQTATAANPITLFASDDQGIARTTTAIGLTSNIFPTDTNGLAFSRTTGEVLNVVYLNATKAAVTSGGFFPAGVNGTIKTSTANS